MTVFAIMEKSESKVLADRIRAVYPNDHFKLADGQWLVSASGGARTVSESLGIVREGGVSMTLVFATSSYFGMHTSETWDWIKSKLEAA